MLGYQALQQKNKRQKMKNKKNYLINWKNCSISMLRIINKTTKEEIYYGKSCK